MPVLLTKETILNKLEANKTSLIDFGVQEIGLFGSYVNNQATEKSDVDLLVDIRKDKKTLHNISILFIFWKIYFVTKLS